MFRLIGILVILGLAAVVVDPSWDGTRSSLTLRLRSASECIDVVRSLGDRVGDRVARAGGDEEGDKDDRKDEKDAPAAAPPPVAAGPVGLDEKPQERITPRERDVLDRLIEEKTRED